MRVFAGLLEECNMIFTYAKALRSLGHETYTVVQRKEVFNPTSRYDEILMERIGSCPKDAGLRERVLRIARAWLVRLFVFLKALVKCDTFIFLFGTSFLPGYWDYPILKMCGKRIVCVFLGGEVCYWYAYQQEVRLLGLECELKPFIEYRRSGRADFFTSKIRVVRAAERFADLILSHPTMGQLQTRPYMRTSIPIDLSQYRFHIPDREVPLVLHAPSDRGAKGTSYVLAAVDQLKKEGIPFEFRLIEGMPNDQLRVLLAEADIVVDQLFSYAIATLALESLATGNVVLSRYSPSFAHIPAECPVVNVSIYTLTDQLRRVILDRHMRRRLAYAGREYVEKYHSHVRVVQQILAWLEPAGIDAYDFVPRFFRDSFVMPAELLKEEEKLKKERCGRHRLPSRIRHWTVWPLVLG